MSAQNQTSSGSGGNEQKLNKASVCEKCGNRHEGPCWPKCVTCGKTHKGVCRYAQPVPSVKSGIAGQGPAASQTQLVALYQAQQAGYQQAYNEMQGSSMGMGRGMGMGMVPAMAMIPSMGLMQPMGMAQPIGMAQPMGGQFFGYPIPDQLAQGYAGPVIPQMGQGQGAAAGSFGRVGLPPRKKAKGEQRSKKGKGEEKRGPLAAKPAGIAKPISKSARQRANKKARLGKEEEKKEEEEKFARDAMTGPVDHELLALLAGQEVQKPENVKVALAKEVGMEDAAASRPEDDINALSHIGSRELIEDAVANPSGFQFPQDQPLVERMAGELE